MDNLHNEKLNTQPVRVLHCVAGVARGGYEAFIMNVYRNIDRSKIQFDFLYSFDGVYKDEIQQLGGKLYQIPFITQKGPFAYTSAVRKFFNEHNEYKIVHSHMDKFSGLIMREAKKAGVPVRIAHSHNIANEGGLAFKIVKDYYGKMIEPNCTDRFACSADAAKWLFGNEKTEIVKNGIDLSKFICKDNRDKDKFVITAVGRFTQQKNHDFLIDVFNCVCKKKDNALLYLAGTGHLQAQIQEKVNKLGLSSKVVFLGDCNDVPSLMNKTDIMCLPSLFEGLGIVFVEAQSCGVKCVTSTNVPQEAKVSDDIYYLPLDKGAEYWADFILSVDVCKKNDNHKSVRDCGYNIFDTAKKLEQFYIDKYSRIGER